jgi:hypothetical protein
VIFLLQEPSLFYREINCASADHSIFINTAKFLWMLLTDSFSATIYSITALVYNGLTPLQGAAAVILP